MRQCSYHAACKTSRKTAGTTKSSEPTDHRLRNTTMPGILQHTTRQVICVSKFLHFSWYFPCNECCLGGSTHCTVHIQMRTPFFRLLRAMLTAEADEVGFA